MSHWLKSLFCLMLLIVSLGCHLKQVVLLPPRQVKQVPIRDRYVFLINMDGARPQEISKWAQSGHLPTIQELFFENGAVFENAINVFPPVSVPNHQAFISGLQPGHHGLPALDWYSRPLKRHFDYLKPRDAIETTGLMFNFLQLLRDQIITDAPQLIFADLQGHPTLAIMEASNHGVTTHLPKLPPVVAALDFLYRKAYESIDFVAIKQLLKHLNKTPTSELPRFSYVNFYGMDNVSHFDLPGSDRALDLAIHYDRFLAELRNTLKRRGIWDKSVLLLVSDHGQHLIKEVVDQPAILRKLGFEINLDDPIKGQIVWGDHGTGASNLYLKIGKNWQRRPSYEEIRNFPIRPDKKIDLVAAFLKQQDIEMVFLPEGPLTTHVFVGDQHARILRHWKQNQFYYRYAPDPGQDPFNYLNNPKIEKWVQKKRYLDAETWLAATANATIPDGVVSVSQIFDDSRAGDLIIQTYKEKQFKESKLSAHGSLDRLDRRVVFMFYGPDIKPGRYPHARTVDTYPTILAILGLRSGAPMDGVLRREILQDEVFQQAPYSVGPHPANGKGYQVREFIEVLQSKQNDPKLKPADQDKLKQLSDELRFFLDYWQPVLNQPVPSLAK